jgi:hypothetical protein
MSATFFRGVDLVLAAAAAIAAGTTTGASRSFHVASGEL